MNEPYFIFYQSAMILSLLASSFVMVLTWRRRYAPAAPAMIALAAATFVWTLAFLFEANSDTLEQQLFFNNIGYIGSMSVPVAWFVFALNYTSDNPMVTRWRIIPFCVIPLVTIVLVWSNSWHHLMWSNEHLVASGPFTVTAKTYGRFFWIAFAYNYILLLTGAIVLIRRLFVGTPLYARQAISLITALSLPIIWNCIYVFNLVPLPRKDLTPVMFAISGITITLGLMRFQLFTAVPVARNFLIQQMNEGILVFDMNNRLLDANPAVLRILGADKSLIGKKIECLFSLATELERLSSTGFGSSELPLIVSGEEHFYELETKPMRNSRDRQVGWLAILHDVTERKKMQEQLIAQDRLASVGELAAGMAHEINNPLTTVLGYTDLLLKRDISDEIRKDLEAVNRGAERAANILERLLTFAGQHGTERDHVDINQILETTLELRRHSLLSSSIEVVKQFDANLPTIIADSGQLQDVFLNIIMNAEYSMREAHSRGKLTITTERTDKNIHISFEDDGAGMSKENMRKIFEPFFTTKPVGIGTGLGLSISHRIITAHGGRIYAKSEFGRGATFTIELPIVVASKQ